MDLRFLIDLGLILHSTLSNFKNIIRDYARFSVLIAF